MLKNQAVFARARFAFIAVTQHILWLGRLFGDERPLQPGREARSAAAQVRSLDLVDDGVGAHRERLLQRLVTVQFEVSSVKVPECVKKFLDLPSVQPEHKGRRVVLEGGSIEVNGKGTLFSTEECLLSDIQCRNPGFLREDYEQVFARYLGISHVIWLGNGIEGDDTHGHIDDLARFVNATTVVTVIETDKNERNYAPLDGNLKRLKAARDQDGKNLDIIELPMPKKNLFDGQILPASYANFLISNNTVLVPTFNDPNDRIALDLLAGVFPKYNVVGIYCGDFILGLGTIHCASQQECA